MKKILLFLLLVLLSAPVAAEDEIENYLPIQSIHIGDSLDQITQLLNQEHVSYEVYNDTEYGTTSVNTLLGVWEFDDCSGADLLFDRSNQLVMIDTGTGDSDSLDEIYSVLAAHLGKPDKIDLPYFEYETDEMSYVEHIVSLYLTWEKDDAVYEVTMTTKPYISVNSDFIRGTKIEVDDTPYQSFSLLIYKPGLFEELE